MKTLRTLYHIALYGTLGTCLGICLSWCAKPDSTRLDVDEIQSQVDVLESRLEQMQAALDDHNLDQAQEIFEEIDVSIKANRSQLSAYPEYGLLKDRVEEVRGELCYERVNINLEKFYQLVREKKPDEARDRMSVCRDEYKRCLPLIQARSDFIALRMNFEGISGALKKLEKEIEEDKRMRNIQNLQNRYSGKLDEVRKTLDECEQKPEKAESFKSLQERIKEIGAQIDAEMEYRGESSWKSFAAVSKKQLLQFESRRMTCWRKKELLQVANQWLTDADANLRKALGIKDPEEALVLVKEASQHFVKCRQSVGSILKSEPRLAGFVIRYKGNKKRAAWMERFCSLQQRRVQRRIQKLTAAASRKKRALMRPTKARAKPKPKR